MRIRTYLVALAIVSIAVANVPLVILISRGLDREVFLGIFFQRPNQYLFLIAFFPVACILVAVCGYMLQLFCRACTALDNRWPRNLASSLLWIVPVLLAISLSLAWLDSRAYVSDLSDLSKEHAKSAVFAHRRVMTWASQKRTSLVEFESIDKMPELVSSRPSVEAWRGLRDGRPKEFLEAIGPPIKRALEAKSGVEIENYLKVETVGDANDSVMNLADALRIVQIAYSGKILAKAIKGEAQPFDTQIWLTNSFELAADLFIAFHILVWVLALVRIRQIAYPCQAGTPTVDLPRPLLQCSALLALAIAMYAVWVGLRFYTNVEVSLITGGPLDVFGEVAALIVITGLVGGLVYARHPGRVPKIVEDAYPVLVGVVALVWSALHVQSTSYIIGSGSTPARLAIVMFAYLCVLAIWLWVVVGAHPSADKV